MGNWARITIFNDTCCRYTMYHNLPMREVGLEPSEFKGVNILANLNHDQSTFVMAGKKIYLEGKDFLYVHGIPDGYPQVYETVNPIDDFTADGFMEDFMSGNMDNYRPLCTEVNQIVADWDELKNLPLTVSPRPTADYAFVQHVLYQKFLQGINAVLYPYMRRLGYTTSYYVDMATHVRRVASGWPTGHTFMIHFRNPGMLKDLLTIELKRGDDPFRIKEAPSTNVLDHYHDDWDVTGVSGYWWDFSMYDVDKWFHTNFPFLWELSHTAPLTVISVIHEALAKIDQYRLFRRTFLNKEWVYKRDVTNLGIRVQEDGSPIREVGAHLKLTEWWDNAVSDISDKYHVTDPFVRTTLLYYILLNRSLFESGDGLTSLYCEIVKQLVPDNIDDVLLNKFRYANGLNYKTIR